MVNLNVWEACLLVSNHQVVLQVSCKSCVKHCKEVA